MRSVIDEPGTPAFPAPAKLPRPIPLAPVAAHVSAFLWVEAVWMSLLLVVLLWIHEWNATALGGLLDPERNGYARVT